MPAKLRWHQFAISLPDFSAMSDSDFAQVLSVRDGTWHPQTKEAMKRFDTANIELNHNWADEYYAWRCPACRREKKDIFRKTESGILKACLEIHHDHLEDYVKEKLRQEFGAKWSYVLSQSNRHIDWIAAALIIRFSNTLICSDCNEVDGRIKSRVTSVDRHFSFKPTEIAACITPQANVSHQINFETAEQIWIEAKPDFGDRKSLVQLLVGKVKAGGLKREETSLVSPEPQSSLTSSHLLQRFVGEHVTAFLGDAATTIVKRSVSKASVNGGRKHRRQSTPTKEDLAQLTYENGASKQWVDAPTSWSCPICARTKLEIARVSNARKWFAAIYEHIEWHRNSIGEEHHIDRHERIDVCGDCSEVFSELKRKKPALSDSFLTVGQIKQVIDDHGPHRTHDIDWEKAIQFATENLKWEKSKAAYWPHYHQAKRLQLKFNELQAKLGTDANATLDALARSVRREFAGWEEHELLGYLHYALEDAKKLPDR